jgi:outer membrane protein OmpA-like peptidoglycan-associated protein
VPALAQQNQFPHSFDAVPEKLTPAIGSGFLLEGARAAPPGSHTLQLVLDSTFGILALELGRQKLGDLIPNRFDAHVLFAYGLHQRIDLGIDLPFTFAQQSNFGLMAAQGFPERISSGGIGDPRIVPRFFLLSPDEFLVGVAFIPEYIVPLADGNSFLGDRGWGVFAPRLAIERPFGKLRLLGDVGFRFRKPTQFLNLYVGSEFVAGVGAVYRVGDVGSLKRVDLVAETVLSTQTSSAFTIARADSLKTPWEIMVGARARVYKQWGIQLGMGRGVTIQSGYGRDGFRFFVGLRYDFENLDSDGDGIPDDLDKCPNEREDFDGFRDDDGCPELDNDGDGIPDSEDLCPNEPGPREYDGCPDRDGDEIPDNLDKCPDEPGPAENDGCPVRPPYVELDSNRIRLRAGVLFDTGEAKIKKESFPILDEVASVLGAHPELGEMQVEGHTDNRGSRPYNLDLSDRRAKSVIDYLGHKGIQKKRLHPRGFGFDRPVADNATALGRAKNRRVMFTPLSAPH